MPTQVQNGKAFEYALVNEAFNILSQRVIVNIIQDTNYATCLGCYNLFTSVQQLKYSKAAIAAINHIIALEPKLQVSTDASDILHIQLQPDAAGKAGDVRDVIFSRPSQNWEIGISAKNNHKALKHSRLSIVKDFGSSWVQVPNSPNYFTSITPFFHQLAEYRKLGTLWKNVPDKHKGFYQPILNAFNVELLDINANNIGIPGSLISYLIGRHDFYKVMKRNKVVEILAFNLHGTLGKSINGIKPTLNIPKLFPPTQIVQSSARSKSAGTLDIIFDQGWQLSFRIHSAETIVAASLKFDVNLIGQPNSMYSHHIPY